MKNHKTGFTLAEILLTLGIIGVLSAIVIPQVMYGVQKDKNGAVLGRAVEQIELGCQNIIQSSNDNEDISFADRLTDAGLSITDRIAHLGLQEVPGDANTRDNVAGTVYSFDKIPAEAYISLQGGGNDLDSIVATIWVDANGAAKPNVEGKDRFHFDLTNSCHMIPVGEPTITVVEAGFKIKD